jgi:hypothetical protein
MSDSRQNEGSRNNQGVNTAIQQINESKAWCRRYFLKETALLPNNNTPLAFPLTLKPDYSPQTIATLGEAAKFLTELTEEQRERGCWKIAIGSLGAAVREPRYIKTATLSLQTALILERMLADPPESA